jgi:hypothetical protein
MLDFKKEDYYNLVIKRLGLNGAWNGANFVGLNDSEVQRVVAEVDKMLKDEEDRKKAIELKDKALSYVAQNKRVPDEIASTLAQIDKSVNDGLPPLSDATPATNNENPILN